MISKQIGCFVLALLFCAVFVAPPILVYGDRSLPFNYVHVFPVDEKVCPNEQTANTFVVNNINPRKTDGRYKRWFTDSKGVRTFLGEHTTNYTRGLTVSGNLTFDSQWTVPSCRSPETCRANPGPALYESEPEFWHNVVQGALKPIDAPPVKIKVTVLPPSMCGTLH